LWLNIFFSTILQALGECEGEKGGKRGQKEKKGIIIKENEQNKKEGD